MKTMKIMVAVVLAVLANCAFALTETVDGVTWNYYTSGGNAILEYPDIRSSTSRPSSVHQGALPQIVRLPERLGNKPVIELGAAALQLESSYDVKAVVIPSCYTRISNIAFTGPFIRTTHREAGAAQVYTHKWKSLSGSGCTNILFLGDCPLVVTNFNWGYQWIGMYNYYKYQAVLDLDNVSVLPSCQFEGCNCFVVEGSQGWTVGGQYCGGDVKYGAAPVICMVDGVVCPDGHVFSEIGDKITLSCPNNTATIHYTIDGSEPTSDSAVYTNPIPSGTYTLKAIAVVPTYPYTVTETYDFRFPEQFTPIITANQNPFTWSDNVVVISTDVESAEIRYTLDGSEPTESSALYTGPFTIDDTTTVKAKAFRADWLGSETATATFTREWCTVDAPIIEPSGAEFENVSQTVSLSCATEGATILYTTDGSDPKVNGREYTKPFAIYKSCTVRAIAVKYDWKDSAEATATFTRGESLSEVANLYGYTMETDSAAPWTVDAAVSHDGVSSVRSGAIGNNGTTYLMASVKKAGMISFWWKAQCEEPDEEDGEDGYYDYGAFLVDDVVKARIAGNDTGWRFVSVEVPTGGKHVLRWEYRKDGATSYAPDCVWVDQVQWSPADGSGYTLTSPEPVPYSWLRQYNLGVASGDFEAAANAASGKLNCGRPTEVWEEYVAGLDPTNANSQLKAMIEMHGETPLVTWEPNLNEDGVARRLYKVCGSETLENGGEWQYPTNSLHRFFKVTVEMP
ncbi:MAG: chitobiase/beta-hexosaminidase C-terminal domain-containing protein [Kiritimatiellae bacterium]|nr:chitobiase/beta-hexosaminidase C-terminal domain-containing protein [Kiritimatiellia bacterium]